MTDIQLTAKQCAALQLAIAHLLADISAGRNLTYLVNSASELDGLDDALLTASDELFATI